MGVVIAPTSPWTFYGPMSDANGKVVSLAVTFDVSNNLTGGTFHRDAGCVYTKLILGSINSDGTYPAGTHVFNINGFTGDTPVSKAALNAVGLTTVASIQSLPQITLAAS